MRGENAAVPRQDDQKGAVVVLLPHGFGREREQKEKEEQRRSQSGRVLQGQGVRQDLGQ